MPVEEKERVPSLFIMERIKILQIQRMIREVGFCFLCDINDDDDEQVNSMALMIFTSVKRREELSVPVRALPWATFLSPVVVLLVSGNTVYSML